jgi:hypothetical protein
MVGLPTRASFSRRLVLQYLATGALAFLLLLPLAMKGSRLLSPLPQCTTNIFEQQFSPLTNAPPRRPASCGFSCQSYTFTVTTRLCFRD